MPLFDPNAKQLATRYSSATWRYSELTSNVYRSCNWTENRGKLARLQIFYKCGRKIRMSLKTDTASDKSKQTPVTQQLVNSNFKRVLILSDSRKASFDCSKFRESIRTLKNNMFSLRDPNSHREAIKQTDIDLISCGINDIRKNHVSARRIHDHVRDFIPPYPCTEFLFDSLSPIASRADPHRLRNDTMDDLMSLCSCSPFTPWISNFSIIWNPAWVIWSEMGSTWTDTERNPIGELDS